MQGTGILCTIGGPVVRGKPGSKIHAIGDRNGLPLYADISAATLASAHCCVYRRMVFPIGSRSKAIRPV
ncbi:hypothetical protein GCM10010112_90540 [Actinoplanes lobatus]|uniref:Uncharacterized protein n=1 Tax=Actinoplanes lobatus TaxID=113568 RepID=A0A7W7HKY5_9ACTN|nr:hypothetical protein [Actinoplanes lobatus]GGN97855.1 hypothetical protein GCM10010112_90540 [Actinoplanes lobatus]GIE45812.1 hypothetical protein Alo02nite_87100 [Actinoplanes lobatus]